jgi:2-keto-4-pentenoate hydratase/2-oxohepta-3-ene-1,7-dioic acid hydratase in catechol pathway
MRFARFSSLQDEAIRLGVQHEGEWLEIKGDMFGEWSYTGERLDIQKLSFQAPVEPRQIIGIIANYQNSGQPRPEFGDPCFFIKSPTSVIGPDEQIIMPSDIKFLNYEAELAVIIGKPAYQINEEDVQNVIFGYSIANDLTAVSYGHVNGNNTMTKVSPTLTPIGPHIETSLDMNQTVIASYVNGEMKQNDSVLLMLHDIPKMISFLTKRMKLLPGDVILTGAPAGAGTVAIGEIIQCSISGIGTLSNSVSLLPVQDE